MIKMRNFDRCNLLSSEVDECAKNLLYTMTQSNPADRISMEEVENSPYFKDEADQYQVINALNEAFIQLDNSEEAKSIKRNFNESFFMVYQKKWKSLPFVVPGILKCSKYNDSLESCLRYCRNMTIHAAQHADSIKEHFGAFLSGNELFRVILKHMPRGLIHFLYFAKRFFPHITCAQSLPENCLKAYEEIMDQEKRGIDGGYQALYVRVCKELKNPESESTLDEASHILQSFERCQSEIRKILSETEAEFKACKVEVKKFEREKNRLDKKIHNLKTNAQPAEEILKATEQLKALESQEDKQFQFVWMLALRDVMRQPEKYRNGKLHEKNTRK